MTNMGSQPNRQFLARVCLEIGPVGPGSEELVFRERFGAEIVVDLDTAFAGEREKQSPPGAVAESGRKAPMVSDQRHDLR